MSNYYLTEAYSYLYTSEDAGQNIFQNLRFMDYLQLEEVQEVMESLIWEFMDYGDSLDEAVLVLETTFSDDDILCESLDLISEARVPYRGRNEMERRREMRQRRSEADAELNKRLDDRKARARRAERAAAIRGALRGAKESVKGALAKGQQYVTNKRSQLAAQGARLATKAASAASSAALQGRAALSRIARTARGAVQGARQAYNAPTVAPSSRNPARQRQEMRQARARSSYQDTFGTPSAAASAAQELRAKTARQGRTTASRQTIADPWQTTTSVRRSSVRDVTPPRMALPPSGGTSGSTRAGKMLSSSQRQTKNMGLSRRQTKFLNASVDYDLLAQYMIEDIIELGYAVNEDDAISFMESMDPSDLNQFANIYLED
jgi:hypothetical protein